MNYNRRSTRPDSLFYREQRKLRRSGRAIRSIKPLAMIIAAAAVVALLWYIFK